MLEYSHVDSKKGSGAAEKVHFLLIPKGSFRGMGRGLNTRKHCFSPILAPLPFSLAGCFIAHSRCLAFEFRNEANCFQDASARRGVLKTLSKYWLMLYPGGLLMLHARRLQIHY